MPVQQLKDNLEYLRNIIGLNYHKFSVFMGCKPVSYWHIKCGNVLPTTSSLLTLSQRVKISIEDLIQTDITILSEEALLRNYKFIQAILSEDYYFDIYVKLEII